jgi:hypothetical protein
MPQENILTARRQLAATDAAALIALRRAQGLLGLWEGPLPGGKESAAMVAFRRYQWRWLNGRTGAAVSARE